MGVLARIVVGGDGGSGWWLVGMVVMDGSWWGYRKGWWLVGMVVMDGSWWG